MPSPIRTDRLPYDVEPMKHVVVWGFDLAKPVQLEIGGVVQIEWNMSTADARSLGESLVAMADALDARKAGD